MQVKRKRLLLSNGKGRPEERALRHVGATNYAITVFNASFSTLLLPILHKTIILRNRLLKTLHAQLIGTIFRSDGDQR